MATVILRSQDNLKQFVNVRDHQLIVDEPSKVGGDDAGPDPYEYLLAGLAGCTAITLLMYARRKKWDLQEVEITVTNTRIHSRDCQHCDKEHDGYIDEIERNLILRGNLDPDQRQRLAYIATRCPVARTLTSPTHIHDSIA